MGFCFIVTDNGIGIGDNTCPTLVTRTSPTDNNDEHPIDTDLNGEIDREFPSEEEIPVIEDACSVAEEPVERMQLRHRDNAPLPVVLPGIKLKILCMFLAFTYASMFCF